MSDDIKNKRPLSPHLTIYKPQISSVLSISHRISGFTLYIGSLLLGLWVALSAYGCARCINPLIDSIPGRMLMFLWSLALYYHLLNGIRHLFWDFGKGYEIKNLNASGLAVVFGAVVLTALSWFYSLNYSG